MLASLLPHMFYLVCSPAIVINQLKLGELDWYSTYSYKALDGSNISLNVSERLLLYLEYTNRAPLYCDHMVIRTMTLYGARA